jgi:drug/metabolite transporter (DMT)-like permease
MGVGLILVLWRTIAGEANFRLGMLWLGVIGMAILGPLGARVFYLYALKHADISKTTLLTHIQPVFVVILAIIILHQYPSGGELLGGVLIILGCCGIIFLRPRILNRFKQLLRNNL